MFYIKFLFEIFIEKPVIAFGYTIGLTALITLMTFSSNINEKFAVISQSESTNPHFYAMIPSTENISYLQRKIRKLPGVVKVKTLSEKKIMGQVRKILGDVKMDIDPTTFATTYGGLEVILAHGLQVRSQELIRSYLERISPSKDLSLGAIQSGTKGKTKVATFLENYFAMIASAVLFIIYAFSSLLLIKPMRKQSFLVETYQRKSGVFTKASIYLHLPLLVILTVLAVMQVSNAIVLLLLTVSLVTAIVSTNKRVVEC